ncbi:MAG: Na(+)-translocating NADH-quinone reductase subunit A [Myxococcales bacterium]|nr:Na(+)-translocating NADH-quinone reductase subunit A [Myxococcales bacterium]
MSIHRIRKGLDLPITGAPRQSIEAARAVTKVALIADDYIGMKPRMAVKVGDKVKRGQLLFDDRKSDGVLFTAPGAGEVVAINRGERRALQSVVIALAPDDEQIAFASYTGKPVEALSPDDIRALLLESGLWTSLRARPFSRVANPPDKPIALFVTAVDTNPLAPSVDLVVERRQADFERGLAIVRKLVECPVYLCKGDSRVGAGPVEGVRVEQFVGKHPAGLVGTHIHMLAPVHLGKYAWHLNYQDVIAIGHLFATGELDVRHVVSIAGPGVKKPRLLETRRGACLNELVEGELERGEMRVISGSVLSGRKAMGEIFGFLGRYHHQISALAEDRERVFLGWLGIGTDKFSLSPTHIGRFLHKKLAFTTTTNGSHRDMVPLGHYERVMPLDIMPTFLLRSLLSGDREKAIELGCLELDEEDLALCTFVDPCKTEFGSVLRKQLTIIEKEG